VKEAIATSPERKWTLGELAAIACVSPSHLAHAFSREVGTSVYRYAIRERLAKALEAVLGLEHRPHVDRPDSGFASHSHFTARFRAFFGLTPDALRRSAARARPPNCAGS
jgi:AraC-like DNA-binding protein